MLNAILLEKIYWKMLICSPSSTKNLISSVFAIKFAENLLKIFFNHGVKIFIQYKWEIKAIFSNSGVQISKFSSQPW